VWYLNLSYIGTAACSSCPQMHSCRITVVYLMTSSAIFWVVKVVLCSISRNPTSRSAVCYKASLLVVVVYNWAIWCFETRKTKINGKWLPILRSAGKRQHSISFVYRSYHLPMPDPSPWTLTVWTPSSYSSEEGVVAGHSWQFTPCGYLSTLWYTLL